MINFSNLYKRYIRHIVLSDIGILGQEIFFKYKILCIGAGGLGSSAITYLASCGIGTIGIVDFDNVDISNLNRQFLYKSKDIGNSKVFLAKDFLNKFNHNTKVYIYKTRLDESNYFSIMSEYDLILDCTDSLESKFFLNACCMKLNLPLIHASVFGFSGYISIFSRDTCCYNCMHNSFNYVNCAGHGILGPVAGVFGSFQAIEAIKYILYSNNLLEFNKLRTKCLFIDFKHLDFLFFDLKKSMRCLVCN